MKRESRLGDIIAFDKDRNAIISVIYINGIGEIRNVLESIDDNNDIGEDYIGDFSNNDLEKYKLISNVLDYNNIDDLININDSVKSYDSIGLVYKKVLCQDLDNEYDIEYEFYNKNNDKHYHKFKSDNDLFKLDINKTKLSSDNNEYSIYGEKDLTKLSKKASSMSKKEKLIKTVKKASNRVVCRKITKGVQKALL
jgi:hypothetical protein